MNGHLHIVAFLAQLKAFISVAGFAAVLQHLQFQMGSQDSLPPVSQVYYTNFAMGPPYYGSFPTPGVQ